MTVRTRLAVPVAGALVALAALAGCGSDDTTPTASDPTTSPAATATGGSSEPTGSGSAETTTVPVYFVGDTPQGPPLFREFRQVAADDPAGAALALMTSGDALDPDYRTVYPGGDFAGVEVGEDAITVSLPDESWTSPDALSEADARLAAQQLVYTVQGVAQSRVPVEIVLDGQPVDLFGLGGQLGAEPELDVKAMVSVTAPVEGTTVRDTFTASGVASSFEATVPWQIRRGNQLIKDGFATAEGWMDKLYPWETEVDVSDLDPGTYQFVAMTDDPSTGEGGGPTEDSKTIIVE